MKKYISFYLALILTLSLFAMPAAVVYGANASLSYHNDKVFKEEAVPGIEIVETDLGSQIFLEFDFSDQFKNYELYFPLDNGKVARFGIQRTGIEADVFLRLENGEYGPAEYVADNDPAIITPNDFMIYSYRRNNYIPYSDYITIHQDSSPISDTPYPKFEELTDKHGFSIRYDIYNIHFLWDGNKFYLSTDYRMDRIYNFTLTSWLGDIQSPSEKTTDSINMYSGVNPDNVKVTSYANDGLTNDRKDMLTHPETAGDDEVSLDIDFLLPTEWDKATKSFITSTRDDILDIEMRFIGGLKGLEVKLTDLLGTPAIKSHSSWLKKAPEATHYVNGEGKDAIKLTMHTLEPSQLYSSVDISPDLGSTSFITRNSALPYATVYTLLKYKIVSSGNDYYIDATPYKSTSGLYQGIYTLYDLNGRIIEKDFSDPLHFPLAYNPEESISKYYQIKFEPKTKPGYTLNSQWLEHVPFEDDNPIGLAERFVAEVAELKPQTDNDFYNAVLRLKLEWDVSSVAHMNNYFKNPNNDQLTAVYDFYRNEFPNQDKEAQDELFTSIELNITPQPNAGSAGSADTTPSALQVRYSDAKTGRFLGSVVLPQQTENVPLEVNAGKYRASVEIEIDAQHYSTHDPIQEPNYLFVYPGVYYLKTRPVTVTDSTGNTKDLELSKSIYSPITLDDFDRSSLPPPQYLDLYEPTLTDTEVSFKATWQLPIKGIYDYMKSHYTNPSFDDKNIFMNMYITSNKDFITYEFGSDKNYTKNYEWRIGLDGDKKDLIVRGDLSSLAPTDTHLYLSQIGSASDPIKINGKYARDYLRENKIVALTNIQLDEGVKSRILNGSDANQTYNYTIDGLDSNQTYYVIVDYVIEEYTDATKYVPSTFSNLDAVTTPDDKHVPDGDDKNPAAPVIVNTESNINEGFVEWNRVTDDTDVPVGTTIEYEIIRLKDYQMDNRLLESKEDFGIIWNNLQTTDKLGLKTEVANNIFRQYNGGSFSGYADAEKYVPSLLTDPLSLRDKTLVPNQVYFYYIRTVKTVQTQYGEKTMYSSWSNATLTTKPVNAPINLNVVNSADKEINKETEIIIEFDAMATPSELGTSYNLQYQLKKDTDSWSTPVTMNVSQLKASAVKSSVDGYYHYTYKITGLDPGTSYQVRVRMIDKEGDASMYSNIDTFRTKTRQKDYDDNEDIDGWLDKLKELLGELIKDPYWITKSTNTDLELLFRPERISSLIGADGQITLYSGDEGKSKLTYYLPSTELGVINNSNKGLKIVHGGMEIYFSPEAVSTATNDAVKSAAEAIKTNKNLEDYYLRIQVDFADMANTIDGNDTIGKQATISMDIVATSVKTSAFETETLKIMTDLIADTLNDKKLYEEIRRKVLSKAQNEEFVQILYEVVDDVKADFIKQITRRFNTIKKNAFPVTALDSSVIIVLTGLPTVSGGGAQTINGYRYNNGWVPVSVENFGSNKAIYTKFPGIYAFTLRSIVIPGLDYMDNGGNIGGIVGKYGLDDYLAVNGVINKSQTADRSMVINSIARIAGAPVGVDNIQWLGQNLGLTISSRNMNQQISTEESIYLVMSLYEAKSKTNISTLRIRNLSLTADITGMNENYKQYIRAAFEVGIYTDTKMQPKAGITIENLLEMLGRLDSKINL